MAGSKACIECAEEKPAADFPRNRRRLDGRDNRCKKCTARAVSERLKRKTPITAPTVSHKVCSRCGLRKPAAQFNNNKVSPDGLCSYCKPCNAAAAAQRRRQRAPVTQPTVATKTCSHCRQEKPATEFHRSKSYKDGLFGQCKTCCARAAARRAKPLVAAPTVVGKLCSRCGESKPATDFNINKTTSSGLTSHCKECIAAAAAARKKQKALVTEPTVAFKVCGRCRQRKGADDFHRTRTRSDGLSSSCKACRNRQNLEMRGALTASSSQLLQPAPSSGTTMSGGGGGGGASGGSPPQADAVLYKSCAQCQEAKPVSQFAVDARKLDGLRDTCRTCKAQQLALSHQPAASAEGAAAIPTKQCRRCGEVRPATEFHRQQSRPDGLYSYCIYCASEYKLERKLNRSATDASTSQDHRQAEAAGAGEVAMGRSRRRRAATARGAAAQQDPTWLPSRPTSSSQERALLAAAGSAQQLSRQQQQWQWLKGGGGEGGGQLGKPAALGGASPGLPELPTFSAESDETGVRGMSPVLGSSGGSFSGLMMDLADRKRSLLSDGTSPAKRRALEGGGALVSAPATTSELPIASLNPASTLPHPFPYPAQQFPLSFPSSLSLFPPPPFSDPFSLAAAASMNGPDFGAGFGGSGGGEGSLLGLPSLPSLPSSVPTLPSLPSCGLTDLFNREYAGADAAGGSTGGPAQQGTASGASGSFKVSAQGAFRPYAAAPGSAEDAALAEQMRRHREIRRHAALFLPSAADATKALLEQMATYTLLTQASMGLPARSAAASAAAQQLALTMGLPMPAAAAAQLEAPPAPAAPQSSTAAPQGLIAAPQGAKAAPQSSSAAPQGSSPEVPAPVAETKPPVVSAPEPTKRPEASAVVVKQQPLNTGVQPVVAEATADGGLKLQAEDVPVKMEVEDLKVLPAKDAIQVVVEVPPIANHLKLVVKQQADNMPVAQ